MFRDVTQILHLFARTCRSIFEAQLELGVSQALRFMRLISVSDSHAMRLISVSDSHAISQQQTAKTS